MVLMGSLNKWFNAEFDYHFSILIQPKSKGDSEITNSATCQCPEFHLPC